MRASFYSDDGMHGKHKVLAIKKKDYPTFDSLQNYLSNALNVRVRSITTPQGRHRVQDIDGFKPAGSYVCSSKAKVRLLYIAERSITLVF